MQGYLGETILEDLSDTPYANFSKEDWALEYIRVYGGIDGDHHKAWLLDQIAQILNGVSVIVSLARWDNGQQEYRYSLCEETPLYRAWVFATEIANGEYDKGIAP